jgi:hypothetical protein
MFQKVHRLLFERHTATQLSLGHRVLADVTVKHFAISRDANVLRREGNVIPNVMEASPVKTSEHVVHYHFMFCSFITSSMPIQHVLAVFLLKRGGGNLINFW